MIAASQGCGGSSRSRFFSGRRVILRPRRSEEPEDRPGGLAVLHRSLLPLAGDLVVATRPPAALRRGLALVGLDQAFALQGPQRRVDAPVVQRQAAAGLLPHALDQVEPEARPLDEGLEQSGLRGDRVVHARRIYRQHQTLSIARSGRPSGSVCRTRQKAFTLQHLPDLLADYPDVARREPDLPKSLDVGELGTAFF